MVRSIDEPGWMKSLVKIREVAEKEALASRHAIETVVAERSTAVADINQEGRRLGDKLSQIDLLERAKAILSGDPRKILSVELYRRRLNDMLSQVHQVTKERAENLRRATVRLRSAEDEEQEARVERKKIETIIHNRGSELLLKREQIVSAEEHEAKGVRMGRPGRR